MQQCVTILMLIQLVQNKSCEVRPSSVVSSQMPRFQALFAANPQKNPDSFPIMQINTQYKLMWLLMAASLLVV